ncbi:TolB-like translocation protein [Flavihumibacter profundi]|uniref:hypothetical protein n=1 Tax=Flavihumibacter profundi TaxID=2716883 RepID=UPI001CC398A5|nr:hypothetical protein [Flavihumibacter profundi]MBZ5858497.1 hypothetical protein [Flavihumibacter profundi]
MQFPKNHSFLSVCYTLALIFILTLLNGLNLVNAQVNTVEFGKNRVQYKKFKWQYYQTANFNTYYSQKGEPLAQKVAQIAEAELPELETFMEYGLQRRANVIVYNSFNDLQQTNIGLTTDWQTSGGNTKLVNNKMVVYYNSDQHNMKMQVRQGIAKVLLDNILFGDNLGEFAANQALLDLPKWLTDGFVSYAAENWSTALDDQLKSAMLAGKYKNFYQFAYDQPGLAGHSFWRYIEETYRKDNTKYFLYLARLYRNLNGASNRICKKDFKAVLADFMTYSEDKYYKDIKGRRNNPKGSMSVVEDITRNKDFYNFTPNPLPRSQAYAVVEYKKGLQKVVYHEDYSTSKTLLKNGIRNIEAKQDPHYPLLAWNGKGNKLLVVYNSEGKIRMFTYDIFSRIKSNKLALDQFEQIQDVKFMLDDNTLLLSAVKNGQSDIFTFKIDREKETQITNDVYDDLDPSFVTFPNKSGILYSSNRPSANAISADTILPSSYRYNIFLIDNFNKSEFKQISQLSKLKYGNARYPTQYNTSHFTFVGDENGIANRFAGFFSTQKAGVDTIYQIGDDILRNPAYKEIDSLLKFYDKSEPDSIFTFAITNDSSYVFPITNYQSGLIETKSSDDRDQVSEVRREGDLKFLYKLKVDENALKKRNINPRPTDFRKRTIDQLRVSQKEAQQLQKAAGVDSTKKDQPEFESEFNNEKADSAIMDMIAKGRKDEQNPSVLNKAGRFDYKLKFSADQVTGSLFNNDVLVTRYEPYTGSLPVTNSSNNGFNGMFKVTVFDLLEDIRFTGMVRMPLINTAGQGIPINVGSPNIYIPGSQSLLNSGSEYMARFDYLKKRLDYTVLYYRRTDVGSTISDGQYAPAKLFTNLFQFGVKYPLDKVRSVRVNVGIRTDKMVTKATAYPSSSLTAPDQKKDFSLLRVEYVYDNAIEKATNIWNGLRYKLYVDYNSQISEVKAASGKNSFNFGWDGRYYYPIYQNFIWAGRFAADFSWGDQKILYYLGGQDGELFPKANTEVKPQDPAYAFQALALNLRGYHQNITNGNNNMVINSEFRFPVFTTLMKRPINNAFARNFQLLQFVDLGTAWNGTYNAIQRPTKVYQNGDVFVKIKAGGVGPFVGGYGFGARSTLLGYFMRLDTGWEMNGFFKGSPIWHFALGVDF